MNPQSSSSNPTQPNKEKKEEIPKITFKEPQQLVPVRKKVPLARGFGHAAWGSQSSKFQVQIPQVLQRKGYIPYEEVKKHNTIDDAWTIFRGKVYDITPYLKYHPGGVDKLMLGAGTDCTQLYDRYHAWVNGDYILRHQYLGPIETRVPRSLRTNLLKINSGPISLTCKNITQVTKTVKTFRFEGMRILKYKPGQYGVFRIYVEGTRMQRSWTISNHATRTNFLEITTKKIGRATTYMHEKMQIGDKIELVGIEGNFTCFPIIRNRILFLTAGIGITPIIAMLRALKAQQEEIDIILLHGDKSPSDVCFLDEILELPNKLQISIHFAFSQSCNEKEAPEGAKCWTGRIDEKILKYVVEDAEKREVYMCGPKEFMQNCKKWLMKMGTEERMIYSEDFTI